LDTDFILTLIIIIAILVSAGFAIWALRKSARRSTARLLQTAEDNSPERIKERLISQGMDEAQAEAEAARQSQEFSTKQSQKSRIYSLVGIILSATAMAWVYFTSSASSARWIPAILGIVLIVSILAWVLQKK
jgi:Flp pilus assembly protein TadB